MSPDVIFKLCSTIAMLTWLVIIILSPFWKNYDKVIIGIVISLFCIVYAWLLFNSFKPTDFEKFGTADGVMSLFTNKTAVVAGWVHYLAFDLMMGLFITKNAAKHGIKHIIIVPCLLLTFMMGPVGLLLYLIIRFIKTKKYFADNF
jgi:hypothetical protein